MVDGILDFLVMILVLGLVVGASLYMTLPLVDETKQMVYEEIYDKTADMVKGEQANEYEDDGYMSYDEIILTVMGQSYFMPKPRAIDICGQVLAIKAEQPVEKDPTVPPSFDFDDAIEFTPNSSDIGNFVRNTINSWYQLSDAKKLGISIKDLRFSLEYTVGDTEQESDNMYALFVLYQTDDEDQPSLHKCLSDGKIQ